jgi:hypothetical protein
MNAAKLDRSDRLQRVKKVLSDGKPHSTLEITNRAHTVAVGSCVAELRQNGLKVDCKRVGNVWYYTLV